ncbi:hypothetical protein EV421DRAFT_2038264 [Armillaria borealis]|uniref:BTB domain-containing protein n=1 Tax=Armillaria borealis TaxID=47425 RepID=A0AA39J706_9AGAR|nr:hypothetical protein EV421DRAFT_2038264 [Armillaria borealis]
MLLTKARPDEWVSARQVKSYFSFPVIGEVGKHTLLSEPFGLGWTAQCVVLIPVIGGSNSRPQAFCNLYVLPGSTPTPPGTLSFHASVESTPEQVKNVETLTTEKAFIGRFILKPSAFQGKSSLAVKITVSFQNDVAPHVAQVPSVILPDVASPEVSLPDTAPPDVAILAVLPPDVTLPDVGVTPLDIGPPEETFPQISRPDPALTYWSRVLKAMKSTLDNDGKLPIDLKFMVYTRISPRGRIDFPKAIFASSVLVEGYTAYLDKYINTGASLVDLDSDDHEDTVWDGYDYDADSDFDFDDTNLDTVDIDARMTPTTDFDFDTFEPAYEEPFSSNHPPSTPTESPMLFPPRSPPLARTAPVSPLDADTALQKQRMPSSLFSRGDDIHGTGVQRPARLGTIWYVKDTAYTTWKALLTYLYTQEISFASLKSNGTSRTADKDACSPKSMYRLAVKAGLGSLKELAFENIRSQLTPSNIVAEVFSKFTHRYPEILDMEVRYLLEQFTDPLVYPQWERKMEEVGRGACPQGASVVNRVMRWTLLDRAPLNKSSGPSAC